jgi:hypothetical protein
MLLAQSFSYLWELFPTILVHGVKTAEGAESDAVHIS